MRNLLTGAVLALLHAMTNAASCDTADHRAFDFWLGQWVVHATNGKIAGHNRIERGYGGCVLHERYTTPGGYSGESMNTYDASRKLWHQTWVDTTGTLLVLEGGLRDGRMVLEGTLTGEDGKPIRQRITWTPNADGSVRQHWETSATEGAWSTAFDGLYRRR